MRLAQIKFALNPQPRFVHQLAGPEKVVGPLPLSGDQQEFDLVVKFGEPLLIVAVVTALDMHEPIAETRAKRLNKAFGEIALIRQQVLGSLTTVFLINPYSERTPVSLG